MRWLQCRMCSHVFTEGFFDAAALEILLARSNDSQSPSRAANPDAARVVSSRIVDGVAQVLGRERGRWLDVGFGSGALLAAAAERGFEAYGVDLRREVVDEMQALGYAAFEGDVERISDDGAFDVVSLADVLEHTPFPPCTLAHVRRLLAPGGVAFLSCPNSDTLTWRRLDRERSNPYWVEIEHYHNFNRASLCGLLEGAGFRIVRYRASERYLSGMEIFARLRES